MHYPFVERDNAKKEERSPNSYMEIVLSLVGFEPTPKNLEGFCPDPLDDKPKNQKKSA